LGLTKEKGKVGDGDLGVVKEKVGRKNPWRKQKAYARRRGCGVVHLKEWLKKKDEKASRVGEVFASVQHTPW